MEETMKKVLFIVSVTLLVTALAAAPVLARGWFLGGGIESVSFGDDLDDVDNGAGLAISFGYRFSSLFALDFLWGGSTHEESLLGGDVTHGHLNMGAKFAFNDPNQFQPYLTVGLASHVVDFDFFEEIDGSGLFAGLGADIFFNPNNALNIGIRSTAWTGEDSAFEYDVTTTIFSIVYNYHFLQ
jgi:hypothetical protein